jgi:hypothetical protein
VTRNVQTDRVPPGLRFVRIAMVLSSLGPLFLLWAVRGSELVPDRILIPVAVLAIALPHLVLVLRMYVVKRRADRYELHVESAEDHRHDVLVYLFTILLPFYAIDTTSWRDVVALLSAVGFIAVLFLHLNLNYMNILFALTGYKIFTVQASRSNERPSNVRTRVLISRRETLETERIVAFRLSDTVFWEP